MAHLTFIHAADIHLGRPFSGLDRSDPELGSLFRNAAREVWDRIVSTAIERRVDFLLLAGDIFDASCPSIRARVAFREGIERLHEAGIRAFLALGNHDPLAKLPDSLRRLPGLYVFGAFPEGLSFPDPEVTEGVKIYGASFERSAVRENLAAKFKRDPGLHTAIGVLHANVSGCEGHENYAPCGLDDLKGAGMDVWCLGHVHRPRILCPDPLVLYSGAAQGSQMRERGPRGCYLVTVHESGPAECRFLPLAPVWWQIVDLDVTGLDTIDDSLRAAESALSGLMDTDDSPDAVVARINLTGETSPMADELISNGEAIELLAERLSVLPVPVYLESVTATTSPWSSLEALKSDQGLVGDFLRECSRAVEDPRRAQELSEAVLRDMLQYVSHSYLAEELRSNETRDDAWRHLVGEAATTAGRLFLAGQTDCGVYKVAGEDDTSRQSLIDFGRQCKGPS
jgi:exonuclease SbcD